MTTRNSDMVQQKNAMLVTLTYNQSVMIGRSQYKLTLKLHLY
jgi:hypothetical protein